MLFARLPTSPLIEPTASVRAFNDQYLPELETGLRAYPLDITLL
jgi:hypothetical protein